MPKILVVEDDHLVADAVIEGLNLANHTVEWTTLGKEALDRLRLYDYDLIVLDLNLPDMHGLDVCREFRSRGGNLPILMLTGLSTLPQKEEGLDAGADDYLTKPFAVRELTARVRALLRRPPQQLPDVLRAGDLILDVAQVKLTRDGGEITLQPKEFALLEFLMRHTNQVFGVQELLNRLWSSESDSSELAVRQTITRLRKKIDKAGADSVIVTVTGLGYKIIAGDK